jgi:hypothetical protein
MLLVGSTSMPMFSKKGRLKTGQQRLQVLQEQWHDCGFADRQEPVLGGIVTVGRRWELCSAGKFVVAMVISVLWQMFVWWLLGACACVGVQVWEGCLVDVQQPERLMGKPPLHQRSQVRHSWSAGGAKPTHFQSNLHLYKNSICICVDVPGRVHLQ